ncbi:alpha/beta fold hydrolase [Streptomyces aureus]
MSRPTASPCASSSTEREARQAPAVLCHGFPELAFSWRHQVLALAEAGYRVLVPDMRGYGGSSRPDDVDAYDILTLCADLAGLLDDVGADDAVFVGHDWGASVVWNMAVIHPERVRAVVGMSVPATPRAPPRRCPSCAHATATTSTSCGSRSRASPTGH